MTDDDIVGIRMTTPGDIKAFARAIEQKVKETNMIKIGQYYFNPSSITWIIEREVHFNNGKSIILTEPELQDLFAVLFNHPRHEEHFDNEVSKGSKRMADYIDKEALKSLNKKPAVKKAKK